MSPVFISHDCILRHDALDVLYNSKYQDAIDTYIRLESELRQNQYLFKSDPTILSEYILEFRNNDAALTFDEIVDQNISIIWEDEEREVYMSAYTIYLLKNLLIGMFWQRDLRLVYLDDANVDDTWHDLKLANATDAVKQAYEQEFLLLVNNNVELFLTYHSLKSLTHAIHKKIWGYSKHHGKIMRDRDSYDMAIQYFTCVDILSTLDEGDTVDFLTKNVVGYQNLFQNSAIRFRQP